MATYCSLSLRYVFLAYVPDVNLGFPTSFFGVGISFLLRHVLIIVFFYLHNEDIWNEVRMVIDVMLLIIMQYTVLKKLNIGTKLQ